SFFRATVVNGSSATATVESGDPMRSISSLGMPTGSGSLFLCIDDDIAFCIGRGSEGAGTLAADVGISASSIGTACICDSSPIGLH
ncbi:hypothetical protein PMAYCL1PPCAC_13078, partial [Pristionchus mayeri]